MYLLLDIYDLGVVMHNVMQFHPDVINLEELLSFDCLNFNECSVLILNLVCNRWNSMKVILSLYCHDVMLHVKFCEDVIRLRKVIAL